MVALQDPATNTWDSAVVPAQIREMKMKPFAILVAAVLSTAPLTAVQAQIANTPVIASACSGAATSCVAIVRATVAALSASLSGDALDTQLGQVAAAVQQGGANATLAGRAIAVSMMREIAASVGDPAQAAAIRAAATDLEAGVLDPLPLIPLPASPA